MEVVSPLRKSFVCLVEHEPVSSSLLRTIAWSSFPLLSSSFSIWIKPSKDELAGNFGRDFSLQESKCDLWRNPSFENTIPHLRHFTMCRLGSWQEVECICEERWVSIMVWEENIFLHPKQMDWGWQSLSSSCSDVPSSSDSLILTKSFLNLPGPDFTSTCFMKCLSILYAKCLPILQGTR